MEDRGIAYNDRKDDLPKLYSRVSKALKLAPSDHTEEQFKAILGGCTTVVNGLGSIRTARATLTAKVESRIGPRSAMRRSQ